MACNKFKNHNPTDNCCGATSLSCAPCAIPEKNLILRWTNSLIGDGEATMVYTPPSFWISPCFSQDAASLTCTGSTAYFSVAYFLSGGCPSGQQQSCSWPAAAPLSMTLKSYTCSPFSFLWTINDQICPMLAAIGFTSFRVSET